MKTTNLFLNTPDEVETAYYEAFLQSDINMMSALWGKEDVICIHPGTGVVSGYDAVVRSWVYIFEGGSVPQFNYSVLKRTQSNDLAVHLVIESLGTGEQKVVVVATNVYQQFEKGWQIVEHHASVAQTQHEGHILQ